MKPLIIAAVFFCSTLQAQFRYRGLGIFGAMTQSAHYYTNTDTDKKNDSVVVFDYFYAQTHHSKEYFNWGAGIFLELGGDRTRWQTELEYCNKGANERELTNAYTGDRVDQFSVNKLTYIQWNNYLKFWYPAGYNHWYWMAGVRLEYLFSKSVTAFTAFSGDFPTFWFSGDVALGYEFPLVKKYSIFVEYHFNPDVWYHTHNNNTRIMNRTLELRVGIVMRPKKKSIDDCNAPVYRGPAY
jgi:hypothetical protein